jgi:hypothetical protein
MFRRIFSLLHFKRVLRGAVFAPLLASRQRGVLIGGICCCVGNPIPSKRSPQAYYSLNAFALPPLNAGRFGSCGVGVLQGPGEANVNAGLAKQFSLTERFRLRFEATFANVLNHTNFAPPALNISNPSTFGVLDATLPQGLGGNRTGQLALRLDF